MQGDSLDLVTGGRGIITLELHDEQYIVTFPRWRISGLAFGVLSSGAAGQARIECVKTKLSMVLNFWSHRAFDPSRVTGAPRHLYDAVFTLSPPPLLHHFRMGLITATYGVRHTTR